MRARYGDLTSGGEMLVEAQLRQALADYGERMVLRKAIPGAKCPCLDDVSESPRPGCRECMATGNLFVDHLLLGRKYFQTPSAGNEQRSPVGLVAGSGPMFMVESIVPVNSNDLVVEVVLDPATNEPLRTYGENYRIRLVNKVVHAARMNDIRGERFFYQLRTEEMVFRRMSS